MVVRPRVSRFVPLFGAAALATCAPARAGSFLMEQGTWQTISSSRTTWSRMAYDANGYRVAAPAYRRIESGWLAEYGLSPDTTLMFNSTFRNVRLETPTGELKANGIGAFEAGARWRLMHVGRAVVSFQSSIRAPARSDPAFWSDNRPSAELRLGVGAPTTYRGREGFADVSIAWVKRAGLSDEVKLDATLGYWQRANRLMLVQYFTSAYPGPPGVGHWPRLHKLEVGTVRPLDKRWSVQVGSFTSRGGLLTRWERGAVVAVWQRF
jgi:hypothetical protein